MDKRKLFVGALATLMALPTLAQSEDVVISGSLVDWYYYGRDYTGSSSAEGWNQQPVGLGTMENPYNYGLISLGLDPGASDGKPVYVADFPIRNHLLCGNSGGVFTGDAYYTFFSHEVDWESGMDGEYGSENWEILVRKWNLNTKTYQQVGKLPYEPTDLTYDPIYDKVYGIFYVESAYKLGVLDMETFNVTFISRQSMMIGQEFRCLAINAEGVLYGIDASGNVATISKEDGTVSYIGNVGFKTQSRKMSATFDFRTGKLYWVGYMNDGKIPGIGTDGTNSTLSVADGGRDTGVYEIDTTTGVATLIGKTEWMDVDYEAMKINRYGKMQITGIYVENAFTRKAVDQKIELDAAPVQLKAGETAEITVNVKNIGTQEIGEDDWYVVLYANGAEVARKSGRDLESSEVRKVKFSYTAPAAAGTVTLYAEVVNAKDEETRNNRTAEFSIVVLGKQLPVVTLQGAVSGNGIVLNWADPDGRYVDGAEEYAPFTYEGLGDWAFFDGDKGYTQRPVDYSNAVNYANWNTPKAFQVFNPEKSGVMLTGSADQFRPYKGEQYFAAFWSAVPDDSETGGHQVQSDNWMISPKLPGKAQTITFVAQSYKGSIGAGYETEANYPELMRVLYSTEETADNFQVLLDTFTVNHGWARYSAELPEGTTYFALQHCTPNGFVLMIDDIVYQGEALEVKGYKLYRNGTLIAELTPSETTYTDARARATDTYQVTAIYEEGESRLSNAVSIDIVNGIAEVSVADEHQPVSIYDLRGHQVQNMQRPGLYIVKTGNQTRKVLVK